MKRDPRHGGPALRLVRVRRALHRWLAWRRSAWWIAGLAVVVLLPTLWSGLIVDDVFHRLAVQGQLGVPIGRLDLFSLARRDPAWRARFGELGVYPWWMGATTQVRYWRPLASLTHFVDYTLWPHASWVMHAENLAWYAALVVACGAFYRRLAGAAWVAGLATAFYAFDQAHAGPVAWIANRNALMATLFGVLAVLAHDRWRRDHGRRFAAGAWLAFGLALLSTESGIAIAGYLVAYAIFLDAGPQGRAPGWRERALSLGPYVVVTALWRAAYRALGHGVTGTGVNCDPLTSPAAFAARAAKTVPLLIASDVAGLPVDLLVERFSALLVGTAAAVGVLVVVGAAVVPLARANPTTRFFLAGAVLSTLPLGGVMPSDRYLFGTGLGVMGVLAQLAGAVFTPREATAPAPVRLGALAAWVGAACVVVRGVFSPLAFPLRAAGPGIVHDEYERLAETFPRGPDVGRDTVVLINTPIDLIGAFLPVVRLAMGQTPPAHEYVLYAGIDDLQVTRLDARTLEVTSQRGWTPSDTDRTFRSTPFTLGETVAMGAMDARVEALTGDGRARVVRFTFHKDLDDPTMVVLVSGRDGLESFPVPPIGGRRRVPAAPLFLSGAFRPRVRSRAVDDGGLASRR